MTLLSFFRVCVWNLEVRGLVIVNVDVAVRHFKVKLKKKTSMVVVSLAVSVSQLASLSTTQNLIIEADPSYKALPLKWRTPLVKSCKYYETCQTNSLTGESFRTYMSCPKEYKFDSFSNECQKAASVLSCNYYGQKGGYITGVSPNGEVRSDGDLVSQLTTNRSAIETNPNANRKPGKGSTLKSSK